MSAEAFGRFLDVMLPRGGHAVTFTEVYIDESYDDEQPPLLVVAGYLFKKRDASEFSREVGRLPRAQKRRRGRSEP